MSTDPLAGPFPTGRELTDYSDDEGYAIPPAMLAGRRTIGAAPAQLLRDEAFPAAKEAWT